MSNMYAGMTADQLPCGKLFAAKDLDPSDWVVWDGKGDLGDWVLVSSSAVRGFVADEYRSVKANIGGVRNGEQWGYTRGYMSDIATCSAADLARFSENMLIFVPVR